MKISGTALPKGFRMISSPSEYRKRPESEKTESSEASKFDTYVSTIQDRVRTMQEVAAGKRLPKNFLGPGSIGSTCDGINLSHKLTDVLEQYHRGLADYESVEGTISNIVSDLRSSYLNMGFDEAEFMPKLLKDVYDVARLGNIRGTGIASWYDGRGLAEKYNGHRANTKDWVYYDSKYYYSSEAVQTTLQDFIRKLGSTYEITDLELPTGYRNGDVRKGLYSSYNTIINDGGRNDCHIFNMIDETIAPPMNFRFFYKGNQTGGNIYPATLKAPVMEPEARFDGILSIWYEDVSFTGRVPVRKDATRFPVSVNMLDVVRKSDSANSIPREIYGFLKNFDFFTVEQSGRYTDSHPRKI